MTGNRLRIYVAGKCSDLTEEGRFANTRRAMEVGIRLWHKGYAPFIPHISHFTDALANELGLPITYKEWLAWDDAYQETCQLFFYDSESSGADREYQNALKMGQPVFRHLDDVPLAADLLNYLRKDEQPVSTYSEGCHFRQEMLIQRLPHGDGLPFPEYQSSGAAGMDLYAATAEGVEMMLLPGHTQMVPTGIGVAIPVGQAGLVLPRSGLANNNRVTLANTPGLVDSDFRGELLIALYNFGDQVFNYRRGVRLAQFVLIDVNRAVFQAVASLPETERGQGGFGSTGLH